MKINIHTKNISLTSAMEEHIKEQFNKLSKYSLVHENTELHLTIEQTKENQSNIKATIDKIDYHSKIAAEIINPDFYQAIDVLVHKFDEQLFKIKDKKEDFRRHKKPLKKVFINSDEDINSDEEI